MTPYGQVRGRVRPIANPASAAHSRKNSAPRHLTDIRTRTAQMKVRMRRTRVASLGVSAERGGRSRPRRATPSARSSRRWTSAVDQRSSRRSARLLPSAAPNSNGRAPNSSVRSSASVCLGTSRATLHILRESCPGPRVLGLSGGSRVMRWVTQSSATAATQCRSLRKFLSDFRARERPYSQKIEFEFELRFFRTHPSHSTPWASKIEQGRAAKWERE